MTSKITRLTYRALPTRAARIGRALTTLLAALLPAAAADAAVSYQAFEPSFNSNNLPYDKLVASFTLPGMAPAVAKPYGETQVSFSNVSGIYNGQAGLADITFVNDANSIYYNTISVSYASGGGFSGTGASFFNVYNGVASLLSGTFNVVYNEKVVASFVPDSPMPEPATWSLMVLGFGAVGALMRRRSRTVVSA